MVLSYNQQPSLLATLLQKRRTSRSVIGGIQRKGVRLMSNSIHKMLAIALSIALVFLPVNNVFAQGGCAIFRSWI